MQDLANVRKRFRILFTSKPMAETYATIRCKGRAKSMTQTRAGRRRTTAHGTGKIRYRKPSSIESRQDSKAFW